MSIEDQEAQYSQLWLTICADEQYAGLCEFIQGKMSTLQSDLSDFRGEVGDSITEEQRDTLDALIIRFCHPPPGCVP